MAEKMTTSSLRSVKIEPGTQKTFCAAHHAAFLSAQYKLLKEFGGEKLHFPAGLMEALAEMVDLEIDAAVESKKSLLTEQLKAKDAERDEALRHIFGMIRTQLHSSIREEREAAQVLDTQLHNFRYIRHQGYDVESGNISSLLMDAEKLTAEIEALHLKPSFDRLKEANEAYKALVAERDAERIAKRLPSMRQLRPQADELYELACQYVQASYLFAPTKEAREEIGMLVDHMNERVRDFKTSHRKSTSQKRRHKKVTSDESPVTSDELQVTSDEHS